MKYTGLLSLFFIYSVQASESASEDSSLEHLLSLPFKDLMQIEIFTANQQFEKASESPSITSVITAQQLKDWGITNIHDALSYLPGIMKTETYLGQTTQTFRGVTPGLFNNKSLYLINGHPAYESLFGSTLVDYIPVEIIERIEVVRSPASVLYGTNAVSGVINIITKQSDLETSQFKLRAGSFGHSYLSASHQSQGLTVSGSIKRDDGYDYNGTLDEWNNPVDFPYKNNLENLYVDSYGDDWRVNLGYFNQSKAKFGINPWVWQTGDFDSYSAYLDANKNFTFDSATLNIWFRYDLSDKDIGAGEFPFPQDCSSYILPAGPCAGSNPTNRDTHSTVTNRVQRYSAEIQFKDNLNNKTSYIIGGSTHIEKLDPLIFNYDIDGIINPNGAPISESQETSTTAIYAQLKYQPIEDLILVAGIRGEKEDDSGSSGLVPRFGATYHIHQDTYIKAMYSEAYRTPVFIEKYVLLPGVLFGNEELEREAIKTFELALDTQINSTNHLQLTLFTLSFEDEILRVPAPAPSSATEYINGEGKDMSGFEIEWKSVLDDKFELIANTSYTSGEDNSLGEDTAPLIAEKTANLILSYNINPKWKATFNNQYVGEKETVFTRLQTPSIVERTTIDSYVLSNINIQHMHKQHEVQLTWNNIFDEDYTYPEPVRLNIPEVPGGPGSSVYLSYSYSF